MHVFGAEHVPPLLHEISHTAKQNKDSRVIGNYIYLLYIRITYQPKKKRRKYKELRAEFIVIVNVARGKSPQDSS